MGYTSLEFAIYPVLTVQTWACTVPEYWENYTDAAKIRMLQKLEFCHYLLADVQLNL